MGLERRSDYDWATLGDADADADPVVQFRGWFEQVEAVGVAEPNAMVLATVDATGRPSVRNVLLRGFDDDAHLVFFSNRKSPKGNDMAANPNVALVFSWLEVHRQVRISGTIDVLDDQLSDAYFESRPRDSQIGAWASRQSAPIADREELELSVAAMQERFEGVDVPRPRFWGGYSVRATEFEFWQGRPSRLHDRLHYWRHGNHWRRERLAP